MEGMSKAEIDRAESRDLAAKPVPMRPRDAATLLLLERRAGLVHVLMGRRHAGHVFMPGKFVFPGGRTDPGDSRVAVAAGLHPDEERRLAATPARARAIAMSAVRETYEEAGLLIGREGPFATARKEWLDFARNAVEPSLSGLRFIARATTPPGRVRRFDTRFLACWRDEVAAALPGGGPTGELEEIVWLPLAEARRGDIPSITRTILDELERRLEDDPLLRPGGPVPYYRMVGNRFARDTL